MLKNYLNVAVRSLLKNRIYSFINVFGLAIGIAAFLLIIQYVSFERSYESLVDQASDIYRVQLDVYQSGELVYKSSENYSGAGPAMLADFPEVINSAKLYNMGSKNNIVVSREDLAEPVVIKQKRLLYAEETFLDMFSYPMVYGDAKEALKEPFKMAISESTAEKYFGNENPIGKFLRLEDDDFNNELCEVTGVFKDSPDNTHLKVDVLISFATLLNRGEWAIRRYSSGWRRKDFYTYIQLTPGTDPGIVESKLPALVDKYKPQNQEQNRADVLLLQPIKDIHLYSRLTDEPELHGNGNGVSYLSIIAYFILIIAWVNYINLSTARSMERGREVGLRKVLGSYRQHLVFQFLMESFVINLVSWGLALLVILLSTPAFRNLGGTPVSYVIWEQTWFWLSGLGIIFIGSLLSGLYPAFVMSSFKPIAVLNGKLKASARGLVLRKGLVVFQFVMAVVLIIGTSMVYQQMNFMQNRDLGFEIDQTIVIPRPSKRDTSFQVVSRGIESLKNGLNQEHDIDYVVGSTMLPGKKLRFRANVQLKEDPDKESVVFAAAWVDYDFINSMKLDVIAGRSFSREYNDHLDTVTIITKNGALSYGYDDPNEVVGKWLKLDMFGGMELRVIGVVDDIHQESLREEQIPIIFGTGQFLMEYYLVKLRTNDLNQSLEKVEKQWYASFPGNPFDYFFLDEYFNSYYEADRQFRDLFAVFAIMAIAIGGLGLFGLSSFTAIQKTKEIAIRKVLGGSVLNIIRLLSTEFLALVLMAIFIAWPLVFFAMQEWLESYPYRIEIDWMSFVLSGLLIIFIALVTISYHTIKSAVANPVDALNYE